MAQSTPPPLAKLLKQVNLPTARSVVYREECTQCFGELKHNIDSYSFPFLCWLILVIGISNLVDSQDSPSGIDVCLTCFNGGCVHFKQ
jgi:uncharacterized UBP type Zn finger protein